MLVAGTLASPWLSCRGFGDSLRRCPLRNIRVGTVLLTSEVAAMRFIVQKFLLLSLTMSAVTAVAQSRYRANIPFSFTIRGESFPSGDYEIATALNSNVIVINSHADPAKLAYLLSRPADASDKELVVKFIRRTTGYSLGNIQVGRQISIDVDSSKKNTPAALIISSP